MIFTHESIGMALRALAAENPEDTTDHLVQVIEEQEPHLAEFIAMAAMDWPPEKRAAFIEGATVVAQLILAEEHLVLAARQGG